MNRARKIGSDNPENGGSGRGEPPPAATEQGLVDGVLRGEEWAFRALLDRFGPIAIAACRRLLAGAGSPEVSPEDCLQEAVLRLIERSQRLTFPTFGHVGKWVVVVARNYCRDRIAKHGKEAASGAFHDLAEMLQAPTEVMESATEADDLVAGLEKDERALLFSQAFLGMTDVELAAATGLKPAAVRTRLSRIRQKARTSPRRPSSRRGPAARDNT